MSSTTPKVYGEVLSGGPIDVIAFIRKPLVISRMLSLLLSIIVFSTIISGGWSSGVCILNALATNCNFVTFVGITAMLLAVVLLTTDFVIPHISSLQTRKAIVISDIASACLYSLLWLVCMGVIIGEWWKTRLSSMPPVQSWQFSCIQAAAAFTIFSLANWIVILFLATRRFGLGKTELFAMPNEGNSADNRNFDSIPGGAGGAVSGGYNNPSMMPGVSASASSSGQPYSISAHTNGSSNNHDSATQNYSTRPTVLY